MIKHRVLLLKEFLLRPIVLVVSSLTGILGLYDTYYPRLPDWLKSIDLLNDILRSLSRSWFYIFLLIISVAIFEGFYKKTSRFLGDQIDANLDIEVFPRQKEGYASVRVHNQEFEDLLEPKLSYLDIQKISGSDTGPKLDEINGGRANISQWIGGKQLDILGNKTLVFNLAKHEGKELFFLFNDGTKTLASEGVYRLVLAINGKMGKEKKKIREVSKTCYLEHSVMLVDQPLYIEQDGELVKVLKIATYIDIRETPEKNYDIVASQYLDVDPRTLLKSI